MGDLTTFEGLSDHVRFVFLYGPLEYGGIETMIVRVANFLARESRVVDVCVNPGGELEQLLDPRVNIRHYHVMSTLRGHFRQMLVGVDQPTIVLSFDSSSAARAMLVANEFGKSAAVRHATGVFHPAAYFMSGEPLDRVRLNSRLAKVLAPHSMFFMNEECRAAHAGWLGMDLADSPIIPLPADAPDAKWQPVCGTELRIVSVGRLVDFKAYNLGAPLVLKQLLDAGINASWDIYGYGELEPTVRAAAAAAGVDTKLRLRGKLAYERYGELAGNYDVFVGMGTAAIEAAMMGLPSVVATVGEKRGSHGFIHELPFGNVGERIPGRAISDIGEMLQDYVASSLQDRLFLSEAGKASVGGFTVPAFIHQVESFALKLSRPPMSVLDLFWVRLFFSLTEGWIRKHLLGRGWKRRMQRAFGREPKSS